MPKYAEMRNEKGNGMCCRQKSIFLSFFHIRLSTAEDIYILQLISFLIFSVHFPYRLISLTTARKTSSPFNCLLPMQLNEQKEQKAEKRENENQ
jgi:hypothetical protein